MRKKIYITPRVDVVKLRSEKLMQICDGSGLDHGGYGLMHARERKVTSAY